MNEDAVFDDVISEWDRQDTLKSQGKFPYTIGEPGCSTFRSVTILTEELGEVARAAQDGTHDELRAELTQLAACALRWIKEIDDEERTLPSH